jgi:hypothetical protein
MKTNEICYKIRKFYYFYINTLFPVLFIYVLQKSKEKQASYRTVNA